MDQTDRITEASRAALAAMARLGVPATPNNYTIWYHDAAGLHPDLSRMLRLLERNQQPLTAQRCQDLYNRFIGTDHQSLLIDQTCSQLEDTMGRLRENLAAASSTTSSYAGLLDRFDQTLHTQQDVAAIQALLEDVLQETKAIRQSAVTLEATLASSAEEITKLNLDLTQAQHQAMTDSLTGLPNRRRFDQELAQQIGRAAQEARPLSLLLLDIDHFKAFNDRHGHQFGDQVLRVVAGILVTCIKGRDTAARLGGEEFAVILPDTLANGAEQLAEQIRTTVANSRVRHRSSGRDLGVITLSIGVAELLPEEPRESFIERADAAMYSAKRAGRNRIATATSQVAATPSVQLASG